MRLTTSYLIRRLVVATLFALIALIGLFLFFDFVAEIKDVDQGRYNLGAMLWYLALRIPSRLYEIIPLAVLLGALGATGQMAANSEIIIMRTSGISMPKLMSIFAVFGLLVAVSTLGLGEGPLPITSRYATQFKLNATQNTISNNKLSGLWFRQGHDIINIQEILPNNTLKQVSVYRQEDWSRLSQVLHAKNAHTTNNGTWQLDEVEEVTLLPDRVQVKTLPHLRLTVDISQKLLDTLLIKPEQMSMVELSRYIKHLTENHQQTVRYELARWRKIFHPLSMVVMAWLALAFIPQQNRRQNMGLRLFGGIFLGLLFYLTEQVSSFAGQLSAFSPVIAAALPTLIFGTTAVGLIWRQERR